MASSATASPDRPELTRSEIEDIRVAFELFDTEGKGKIESKDLQEVIESLGLAKHNAANLVDILGKESSELDFDRFVTLLTMRMGDDKDDLRRVFDLFDENQTGYITIDDLKRIAADLGEAMSEEELQEMIDRADTQEKGKVSPEEFYTIMTKKLFS